jgi:hypothetical protein
MAATNSAVCAINVSAPLAKSGLKLRSHLIDPHADHLRGQGEIRRAGFSASEAR